MIDGRHCTKQDLDLLIKKTKKIKNNLQNADKIRVFIDFVMRFDEDIASALSRKLNATSDIKEKGKIIDTNINALMQNVYTDIYEHQ